MRGLSPIANLLFPRLCTTPTVMMPVGKRRLPANEANHREYLSRMLRVRREHISVRRSPEQPVQILNHSRFFAPFAGALLLAASTIRKTASPGLSKPTASYHPMPSRPFSRPVTVPRLGRVGCGPVVP